MVIVFSKLLLVLSGSYIIVLPIIFEVGIKSVNVIEYDGFCNNGILSIL